MSEIALHELPAAAALTGAEIVPVDDGSATVRTTVAAIRAGLAAAGHGHAVADVAGLQTALDGKAPLASPSFTGNATVAGVLTASGMVTGNNISGLSTASAYTIGANPSASIGAGAFVAFYGSTAGGRPGQLLLGTGSTVQMALSADGTMALGGDAGGGKIRIDPGASGRVEVLGVPALPSYTVATLPTATARGVVYVSNGASNRRLAVADGLNWRWPDGTVVS